MLGPCPQLGPFFSISTAPWSIPSPAFWQAAWRRYARFGHEGAEIVRHQASGIGPPLEDVLAVPAATVSGTTGSARRYRPIVSITAKSACSEARSYPGIDASLLEAMQQAGFNSIWQRRSGRRRSLRRILEHLKLTNYFDGIHGSVPGGELDHKPELLAHIFVKARHLSPAHSLMVGDRRHDISGAHAVGMRGLGVLWGYGARDELETAGADRSVKSTDDLARTVISMCSRIQSST